MVDTMKDLNGKLAKLAGFDKVEIDEPPWFQWNWRGEPPVFTDSLDACWRWLFPLVDNISLCTGNVWRKPVCFVTKGETSLAHEGATVSEAVCQAILKIVEEQENA